MVKSNIEKTHVWYYHRDSLIPNDFLILDLLFLERKVLFFVGKSVPIYFRDSIFCSVVSLQAIFSLLSYQTEMLSARKLSGLQQRWLWSWLYRSRNRITTKHVTGMKQTPAKSCDQPVFPPSVLFAWWEIIISTTVRVITGKWKKKKKYWRRQEKEHRNWDSTLFFYMQDIYPNYSVFQIWFKLFLSKRYLTLSWFVLPFDRRIHK